jgi:hypothetical protein
VLEFLTAVEKEFRIQLEPGVIEFEFLRDVAALAAYIEDRIGRTPGLETDGQDGSANQRTETLSLDSMIS